MRNASTLQQATGSPIRRSRRVKDTVSDHGTFGAVAPNLPPEFYHVHKWLSPILGSSCETLMELNMHILENISGQIHTLLQIILASGHAQQWPEFSRWVDLHTRVLQAISAKKANEERAVRDAIDAESSRLGYPKGSWLPVTEEQLSQDCWKGPADQEYLRNLYAGAMEPVHFDWDNGASSNEEGNPFVDKRLLPMDPTHFDWNS